MTEAVERPSGRAVERSSPVRMRTAPTSGTGGTAARLARVTMPSILVVCTGNVCRSPIAEGMLRDALARRFGPGAVMVSSAGTSGWEGSAAMSESVQAAAERGVDIGPHLARLLTLDHVRDADLVIAMAEEHRSAVAAAVPDAGRRIFTLKQLVRLLEALPALDPSPGPSELADRVAQAAALREDGFDGNAYDDDVVDPLGLPLESYRAIAWELEQWNDRLVAGLFGTEEVATAREGASP